MKSKSLLIAIAAFAVTATGAQAYVGSKQLQRIGLSEEQRSALSEARELQAAGDATKARDVLVAAGLNEFSLMKLRHASHAAHQAIRAAVEANDFEAFKKAVVDTPIADIVTTSEDFAVFVEAHRLKAEGEWLEAKELLAGLGLPTASMKREGRLHAKVWGQSGKNAHGHKHFSRLDLTPEQREALLVAKQANDVETVRAIWREAGLKD